MEQQYYTMSETAGLIGETAVTVRFWSNTFPKYVHPRRNLKGNRLFSNKDIDVLKQIKHYSRECGFSLEAIAGRLTRSAQGQDPNVQIRESLLRIREQLLEIKAGLE